jgi:hypothetical protein
MFWFGITALFLSFSAWGLNLGLVVYNLLFTEMIWPVATIIFCCNWLAIYLIQRTIMAPIGKRLAVKATDLQLDALEEIGHEMMKDLDTAEYLYLRNRKGSKDE